MTQRMTRAAAVPVATEWLQVDVAAALAHVARLREQGLPVTFTTLVLAAVATGLREYPELAAEVDYEHKRLRVPDPVNVGVAVASERGLVVPVVRDVLTRSFADLAEALQQVVDATRSGSKTRELFSGGNFTITNIAGGGIEGGTPLMNFPEIAILGIGWARDAPVVVDGELRVSKVSQFTVALDHRILDGVTVAHFLVRVRDALQRPEQLSS